MRILNEREQWSKLRSVAIVESKTDIGGNMTSQTGCYISSLPGDAEQFFEGQLVRAFQEFADQAPRLRTVLDNAASLRDLAGLPSNRLETLSGDRAGQYSIRINRQWRICLCEAMMGPATWGSWTITELEWDMTTSNGMRPVHPGEISAEELDELGLSANALTKALDVPTN